MADMVATYIRARSTDTVALDNYWEIVEPMEDGEHGVEFGAVVADRLASAGMVPQVKSCMVWTWDYPTVEADGTRFWSFETKWESPKPLIEDLRALFPTVEFEVWDSNHVGCDRCDAEIDRGLSTVCDNCGFDNE